MPLLSETAKLALKAAAGAAKTQLPSAGPAMFRRNYIPSPLIERVNEISPKVGLFTKFAKFQIGEGAGNCDVHHASLAGEVVSKLQEGKQNEGGILSRLVSHLMGSKPQEATPAAPTPNETPEPSTIIPPIPDEHIEKKSEITAESICDAVRENGFALFKHYDEPIAVGGAYDAHHVVIVAGVFEMPPGEGQKPVPHAIIVDCDPNRVNLATERAREALPKDVELHELSSEKLDELGAKESFVRIVNLNRMVTRSQGNWNSFKGRLESGAEPFAGKVDDYKPTITSVSREYLEKTLPSEARHQLLDPGRTIQAMGVIMQGNEDLIDYGTKDWRARSGSDVAKEKSEEKKGVKR